MVLLNQWYIVNERDWKAVARQPIETIYCHLSIDIERGNEAQDDCTYEKAIRQYGIGRDRE